MITDEQYCTETSSDNSSKIPKQSQATFLADIGLSTELFHTETGEVYSAFAVNGHRETWGVKSQQFQQHIKERFYKMRKAVPHDASVREAIGTIMAMGSRGPERAVFTRLARVKE